MSAIYELELEAPPGEIIDYDPIRLASALQIEDPSRLAVETDGMRRALVTIYPSDPLAHVALPDPAELVMDAAGRIWVGRFHNGRPSRLRVYDPRSGSAQRFFVFGTTGAGKSIALQIILAGGKRSGIIEFVADLKGGQSIPEADGNVDWFVRSPEGAMAMLHTAWLILQERQDRYAAAGRSKFLIGRPDRLLWVWIDEANRLLEKGAPYRDLATAYIKDIGRTGRSLGVGIGLAAQASHLEELGGSDTLRAMLKDGEVVLLRWTSSMMRQLVSDGLLAAGQTLLPIPKYSGATRLISQFDQDGDEDLPGTHGTAYLLTSTTPTAKMRFFDVATQPAPDGLDPKILALYGEGRPARLERASWKVAGQVYAERLDGPEAFSLCFPEPDQDGEPKSGRGGETGGRAARRPAHSAPAPKASRTVADRVQAVLQAADGDLDAYAVWEAVNADGGREISLGSVKNALSMLRRV